MNNCIKSSLELDIHIMLLGGWWACYDNDMRKWAHLAMLCWWVVTSKLEGIHKVIKTQSYDTKKTLLNSSFWFCESWNLEFGWFAWQKQ